MVVSERRYPQLIGNCKGGWLCGDRRELALERMSDYLNRYSTEEAFKHFDEEKWLKTYCVACRILGFLIVWRRSK